MRQLSCLLKLSLANNYHFFPAPSSFGWKFGIQKIVEIALGRQSEFKKRWNQLVRTFKIHFIFLRLHFTSSIHLFLSIFVCQVARYNVTPSGRGDTAWRPPGSVSGGHEFDGLRLHLGVTPFAQSNVPKNHTISQSCDSKNKNCGASNQGNTFCAFVIFLTRALCCQAIIDGPWCDVSDRDGRQVLLDGVFVCRHPYAWLRTEASPARTCPSRTPPATRPWWRTRGPISTRLTHKNPHCLQRNNFIYVKRFPC